MVNSRISEWLGLFTIQSVDIDKKIVCTQEDPTVPFKTFNLVQVKTYYKPEILPHSFLVDLEEFMAYFRTPEEEQSWLERFRNPAITEQ